MYWSKGNPPPHRARVYDAIDVREGVGRKDLRVRPRRLVA